MSEAAGAEAAAGLDRKVPAGSAGRPEPTPDRPSPSRPVRVRSRTRRTIAGGSRTVTTVSPQHAKTMVILAMSAACLIAEASRLEQKRIPTIRILAGTAIGGTLLLLIAEVSPAVAQGFAMLILVSAMLVFGGPAWHGIGNVVSAKPGSATPHPAGGGGTARPE